MEQEQESRQGKNYCLLKVISDLDRKCLVISYMNQRISTLRERKKELKEKQHQAKSDCLQNARYLP